MKILFISYYFPPYNTVGAVRVGKNARYLTELGHEVRVLAAADPMYETKDMSLPVEIDENRIVRTKWLSVTSPGRLIRRLLKPQSDESAVSETPSHVQGPAAPPHRSMRLLQNIYINFFYLPDAYIGWYSYAVSAGVRLIRQWRPDLIVASVWPVTGALVASRIARRTGVPWVCEYRDLWTDNYDYTYDPNYWKLRRWLDRRLEKRVMRSAMGFVTVSRPLADILVEKYHRPTAVVLNGYVPDQTALPDGTVSAPKTTMPLELAYTGTIYPLKQDPEPLFEALRLMGAQADEVRINFYLRTHPAAVQQRAQELDVSHLLRFHSHVTYDQSQRIQREADILLLLVWTNPREKGFYSTKIFEYLGARRPILAIGLTENVAADMVRDRQAGLVSNDPEQIAKKLRDWITQKQQGGIPRLPAEVAHGLSRKDQAAVLNEFLTTLQ